MSDELGEKEDISSLAIGLGAAFGSSMGAVFGVVFGNVGIG